MDDKVFEDRLCLYNYIALQDYSILYRFVKKQACKINGHLIRRFRKGFSTPFNVVEPLSFAPRL